MPSKADNQEFINRLALFVQSSKKTAREIAREARLDDPDLLEKILRGEAQLPLDKAADVAWAFGSDPATFVATALAAQHPEIAEVLEVTPHAFLGEHERRLLHLYWKASPSGRMPIRGRRRRLVCEALDLDPAEHPD